MRKIVFAPKKKNTGAYCNYGREGDGSGKEPTPNTAIKPGTL